MKHSKTTDVFLNYTKCSLDYAAHVIENSLKATFRSNCLQMAERECDVRAVPKIGSKGSGLYKQLCLVERRDIPRG